jgi:hypothetical protein
VLCAGASAAVCVGACAVCATVHVCVTCRCVCSCVCRCSADTGVCACFGSICSNRRVCVCAVCRDTCMLRAFNPIMARSAPQHAFARVHTTHAGSLSTHTAPIHPLTLSRALWFVSHSPQPRDPSLGTSGASNSHTRHRSVCAHLLRLFSRACEQHFSRPATWPAPSRGLRCCNDSLIHHSRPSHIVLNQAPSTQGEPGGTNRSPPVTARVCLRGAAGPVPLADPRALHRSSHSRRGPLFTT